MSVLSIRLPDKLLYALDHGAAALHLQRAAYIRKAIELMNKMVFENESKQKLIQASLRVREDSMRVNAEFSEIENDSSR